MLESVEYAQDIKKNYTNTKLMTDVEFHRTELEN